MVQSISIHGRLVTSYGEIELAHYGLRSFNIYLNAISQDILRIFILDMSFIWELQPDLPGTNELIYPTVACIWYISPWLRRGTRPASH